MTLKIQVFKSATYHTSSEQPYIFLLCSYGSSNKSEVINSAVYKVTDEIPAKLPTNPKYSFAAYKGTQTFESR